MELILELLYESRKSYIEWKQIICAVFLALLFSGMYYYMSVQAGYEMRGRKEMAVSADSCVSSGMETGRELLPDIFREVKGRAADRTEAVRDVLPGEHETTADTEIADVPAAVSFAEDEPDILEPVKSRDRNVTVKKSKSGNSSGKSGKKVDYTESRPEEIPVLPSIDAAGDIGGTGEMEGDIKVPELVVTKEISGFICNGEGHITGYADPSKFMKASLVVLPWNTACTGIRKGAFRGLEEKIEEIYIPANITYIEAGAFDTLDNLIFIESDSMNAEYRSANGVLYNRDGSITAYPNRLVRPDDMYRKRNKIRLNNH